MGQFKGKVLVVVNVASKCGFTHQYKGLVKMHEELKAKGLVVLAFPCDQFLRQEFRRDDDTRAFACAKFNLPTDFFLMSKVDVNGPKAHPVWQFLKAAFAGHGKLRRPSIAEKASSKLLGNSIKWNFSKFLVDGSGVPVRRYSPMTSPARIAEDARRLLAAQPLAQRYQHVGRAAEDERFVFYNGERWTDLEAERNVGKMPEPVATLASGEQKQQRKLCQLIGGCAGADATGACKMTRRAVPPGPNRAVKASGPS